MKKRTGILLINLGTPEKPTSQSVRKYLGEFLWDPRIVSLPRWLWSLILQVILIIRPKKSALAYQKIWMERGSPLLVHSLDLESALQNSFRHRKKEGYDVKLAMRYGSPSIASGLKKLRQLGVENLLVVPLYPQYSSATTASTFDAIATEFVKWKKLPSLKMVMDYHDYPGYIDSVATSVKDYWDKHGKADRLMFSFHGLPKKSVDEGDPYQNQCRRSASLIAQSLGLDDSEWVLCFQSRFGKQEWLKPYTDQTLLDIAKSGLERLDVVCPGFSADCLETLEEIDIQYRDLYHAAGGKTLNYIPALNASDAHVEMLADFIEGQITR